MKKHSYLLLLIAISFVVHFFFFGHPNETVFDEVHFGKFISGYFTHEYFFDIHPPLGKLLISGMGYLGDFKPGFSFAQIGQTFPDNTYLWLRFLPTLAGALLPIVIFFLALRLKISRLGSFTAGIIIVFENSLLVQSRFILLDPFLLLFGFLALLAYFKYREEKKFLFLLFAGILSALSMSVKWTGTSFLGLIIILEIISILKRVEGKRYLSIICKNFAAIVIVPLLIYFSVFIVHLELLKKSGPGDAFMSPAFQKTLAGNSNSSNQNIEPLGLFGKILELNVQMYKSNATLTASHPYSSPWYTWPFMTRPIYYWFHDGTNGTASRVYFMGNPFIWWLSTMAIIYGLLLWSGKIIMRLRGKFINSPFPLFILIGFSLNLLPFIGINRAMFLYHYLSALIFAILSLVYLLDGMKKKRLILALVIIVSFVFFILYAPLSYGLPLSESAFNIRAWFPSWQ